MSQIGRQIFPNFSKAMKDDEPKQLIRFAKFELDAARRRLSRDGEPLALNAKAFDLLVYLAENAGRVVTKDEILDAVWDGQFVEEANLTVQMSALRKALGERKDAPQFLATIPGKGYEFIAEIENGSDDELVIEKHKFSRLVVEDRSESSAVLGGVNNSSRKNNSKTLFLIAGFLAIALLSAIGGFWLFNQTSKNRGGIFPVAVVEKQPRIKRLTSKGRVEMAVLSPDGKFFAYSLLEIGSYRSELRLGQTDGSSDAALLPLADTLYNPVMFSRDGSFLYYMQRESRSSVGTLYKIPVLGGVAQKMNGKISIYAAISPDEKQIAFVRNSNENKTSALVAANLDGTDEREIAVRPFESAFNRAYGPSWSPDASMIAVAAKTGKTGNDEIFIANMQAGNLTQLTAHEWKDVERLDWLKDGSGLVVAQDKESVISTQIWQIDYPSGTARKITRDLLHYGNVSVAGDAFVAIELQRQSNIWVAPSENLKEAKQITFSSSGRIDGWNGLNWTADGRIVYTARIDQSSTLWIMNAGGANQRQLTPIGFQDLRPCAVGEWIVFESDRSGKTEIWRVRADGGDLAQITFDGGNASPSLLPDGATVIYQHGGENGENSVRRIALTGGESMNLIGKNCSSPRVSSDGNFIACGLLKEGKTKLAVFSINGGEPLKLFDVPPTYNFDNTAIRWSPDSRFIAYRDWFNGIWTQAVKGGEPELLENLPAEKYYTYSWSPDGKQFAFTRGRAVRDAVLITDFR